MPSAQIIPFPTTEPFDDAPGIPFSQEIIEDIASDHHLVLRETPPRKLRERWAHIQQYMYSEKLRLSLLDAHIAENIDHDLTPLPKETKDTRVGRILDKLGVIVCRVSHPIPNVPLGKNYSQCPSCNRKYALPWVEYHDVPEGVYFHKD